MISSDIVRLIDITAERTPDKAAIIYDTETISYQDLLDKATRLAGHLQQASLQGQTVVLYLPNSLELTYSYLACFKAGCIAVPINYRYKAPEAQYVLQHSQAKWLFIHEEKLEQLDTINLAKTNVEKVFIVGGASNTYSHNSFSKLMREDSAFKPGDIAPQEYAVIFYTSGTTGNPKGVVHTYRSCKALFENAVLSLKLDQNSLIPICLPMGHMGAFVQMMGLLMAGGMAVLFKEFNVDQYISAINHYKPTALSLMPPYINEILHSPRVTKSGFENFVMCCAGGDVVTEKLQRKFFKLTGKNLQQAYGMTEGTTPLRNDSLSPQKAGALGTVFDPLIQVAIVNKKGEPVPTGEIGEIQYKGPILMECYWHNPEQTKQTLVNGWLKTGDLGRVDEEGLYWFAGRIKQIIIRKGSNIVPQEVEAVFYQHPAVRSAGIIGVDDDEEGQVPLAFISLKEGETASKEELMDFARERIANYKLPVMIRFLHRLPIGSSGKIDRKALHSLALQT